MQKIIETEQSVKSAHHRIDKVENEVGEIKELTIAVKEIAMETKKNREDLNKMDNRIKNMEDKPAKSWENLKWLIVTGIVTAVLGFFLGKLGL